MKQLSKRSYTALRQVEQWTAKNKKPITEQMIQKLHALVMSNGRLNVKPSSYREGQNIIRDNRTKSIIYLPPEGKDVSQLMNGMVKWIENNESVPCPLIAGIILLILGNLIIILSLDLKATNNKVERICQK